MTIRNARPQDADAISQLMLLAMEEIIYDFICQRNKQEALNFLAYFIRLESNQYSYQNILVVEDANVIIAQVCLYPGKDLLALRKPIIAYLLENYGHNLKPENETQEGEIYLDTLAVSTLEQGKGIGKILLQFVIDKYVYIEKQRLGLLVDKINPNAKSLYLKLGFEVQTNLLIFGKEMEHLQVIPTKTEYYNQ
ncbi:GNAT family N-acetyltransferase [Sphingobacterium olei]|uniref:GNAT family N-acetyltransferase n=1 Tax=Sphingobacterium olei TaxID=2571155 RepID=A0A4U0NFZ0_9SPHI|nr:GNAT family N-acetyltransferase [Sphingobacterium olei]TJZ52482.1 GNAT family N-acetyltransferase [Sphingobacterium olei]